MGCAWRIDKFRCSINHSKARYLWPSYRVPKSPCVRIDAGAFFLYDVNITMTTLALQIKLKLKKFDEVMIKLKTKYLDNPVIYSELHKLDERKEEIQKLVDNSNQWKDNNMVDQTLDEIAEVQTRNKAKAYEQKNKTNLSIETQNKLKDKTKELGVDVIKEQISIFFNTPFDRLKNL